MAQITENGYIDLKIALVREQFQMIVTSLLFNIFEWFFLCLILIDALSNFSSRIKGWLRAEDHQNSNA